MAMLSVCRTVMPCKDGLVLFSKETDHLNNIVGLLLNCLHFKAREDEEYYLLTVFLFYSQER